MNPHLGPCWSPCIVFANSVALLDIQIDSWNLACVLIGKLYAIRWRRFETHSTFARTNSINFRTFNCTLESWGMCIRNRFRTPFIPFSTLEYFEHGIYLLVSWSPWMNAHAKPWFLGIAMMMMMIMTLLLFSHFGMTWSSSSQHMCLALRISVRVQFHHKCPWVVEIKIGTRLSRNYQWYNNYHRIFVAHQVRRKHPGIYIL